MEQATADNRMVLLDLNLEVKHDDYSFATSSLHTLILLEDGEDRVVTSLSTAHS